MARHAIDPAVVPGGIPSGSPRTWREAMPIFLRHGSPRILLVATAAALAARITVGEWSLWDLAPAAGILVFWPLQEWLIHVFILHARPRRVLGRTLDFAVPRKHREHHADPWNHEILFIPMQSWIYSLPLMIGLWLLITPTTGLALTGITLHLALALHYELIHFLVHTRVQPGPRMYQRLWRNHRLHHFKNEHYWYGVTRLEADRLLGTSPAGDAVDRSPTVRTLWAQPGHEQGG